MVGQKKVALVSPSCPIIFLKHAVKTLDYEKFVVTGEVFNSQQIVDIPTVMQIDGNYSEIVYYVGGLKILIKFINKKDLR